MHEILRTNNLDSSLKLFEEGRMLCTEEVADLEKHLQSHPRDLEARALILGYYLSSANRPAKGYREHVQWVVANLPGISLGPWCTTFILPEDDPQIFEALEDIWDEHVLQNPGNFDVLFNSSIFYESSGRYKKALDHALLARKLRSKDNVAARKVKFLQALLKDSGVPPNSR